MRKSIASISMITLIAISAISCSKSNSNAGNNQNGNGGVTGTHSIDARLVGKWMWTKASDGAYYDNNGVYNGAASGFALQFNVNPDASGTCFNHIYSSIGVGTALEVNISYTGFFETDSDGHLGFFPTGGTYTSTSTPTRPLRADELWNVSTQTGRSITCQNLVFTTQGGRGCFQVTSSDGTTDTFFKQ